jgi:hypothetical protein
MLLVLSPLGVSAWFLLIATIARCLLFDVGASP